MVPVLAAAPGGFYLRSIHRLNFKLQNCERQKCKRQNFERQNFERPTWERRNFKRPNFELLNCREPAISHDSHHVSLVQWTNLLASRHKGHRFKPPGGDLYETGILLLALSRYIGDPDVIHHQQGFAPPQRSLGPRADNVTVPLDLTQLSCPGFTLAAGLPSGFTTDGVSRWGGALWRVCNLTSFSPCLTGPVDYPFASVMRDPGSNPLGGTYVKSGFSC
jgi:hypothetical protein